MPFGFGLPDPDCAAAARPRRRRARRRGSPREQGPPADAATLKTVFKPYHSVAVPKCLDLEGAFQCGANRPQTTAMLRNIPNRYTQASLLREIDAAGFEGTYDFFYLPMDTQNRTNVGYAFINFLTSSDMEEFTKAFAGYRFKDHASQKIGRVSPAHLQGFHENVRHFSNRAVAHARNSQYRPVILYRGQQRDVGEAFAVHPEPAVWPPGLDLIAQPPGIDSPAEACLDATAEAYLPAFLEAGAGQPEVATAWTDTCNGWADQPAFISTGVEPGPALDAQGHCWEQEPQHVPLPLMREPSTPSETAPQRAPCRYGAPGPFCPADGPRTFSVPKNDLELAVSMWLKEKASLEADETLSAVETSTVGEASASPSTTASPRSVVSPGAACKCIQAE